MSLTCPHCKHELGLVLSDLGVAAGGADTGADQTQMPDATGATGANSLGASSVAAVFALKASKTKRKARTYHREGWQEFWKVYPLHLDKGKAYDAFCAALDAGADGADLIAGAARYAEWIKRNGIESRHVKYAQGWLNGERWTDELELADPTDPAWIVGTPEYAARIQAEEDRAIREMA